MDVNECSFRCDTLTEIYVVRIALLPTYKLFYICSTDRTFFPKEIVEHLELLGHDLHLIISAAQCRGCFQKWTYLIELSYRVRAC